MLKVIAKWNAGKERAGRSCHEHLERKINVTCITWGELSPFSLVRRAQNA